MVHTERCLSSGVYLLRKHLGGVMSFISEEQSVAIEKEFKKSGESYKCLAICINHISEEESNLLDEIAEECDQVLEREYGHIIKLLEEDSNQILSANYELFVITYGLPVRLMAIFAAAYQAGYRFIELDSDAKEYEHLEKFDW
jgi:hypothetical protein